jgi:hypothetical protein
MVEDINADYPEHWPRPGDRLFVQTSCGLDAQISTFRGERLYRMKKAFKTSADHLVSYSEDNPHERANLVWPIVFCYRQYIELALKDMIATYGLQVTPPIQPNWVAHALLPLWKSYKKLLETTLTETNVDQLSEVSAFESCIYEFDQVDPGSYTFRYPTDKKGVQTEIQLNSIDLYHLRKIMEGIYLYLDATETVLDEHFDPSNAV